MIRAPLEVYSNRSGQTLARKICEELSKIRAGEEGENSCGTRLKQAMVRPGKDTFACGEFKVNLEDSVRGKDVFLVQCMLDRSAPSRNLHENMWETVQTIEALKGCHAQYVSAVIPCLPYSRQDKTDGRESYGSVVMAKALSSVGVDQVITFDLHAQQIKGFYRMEHIPLDALFATNLFINHIKSHYGLESLIVAAPDEGGGKRAKYYADILFGEENVDETRLINTIKNRSKKASNRIDSLKILGNVSGKVVLVADDLIDTAGTMEAFVDAAYAQGAKGTIICATHPILSDPATRRLDRVYGEGKLLELLATDTVPQPIDYAAKHQWFNCFSVAPLLADIIDKINKEEGTSPLYLAK